MAEKKSKFAPIQYIKEMLLGARAEFRVGGMKAVVKKYGWKIFALFFTYYLIRDSILYIVIPYLVARHFL